MSLVLEALSKAEKLSKKDKYVPSAEQEKIGEIKNSFQKKLLLIVVINLAVISIILFLFFMIYLFKNDTKPVSSIKTINESEKVSLQNDNKRITSENENKTSNNLSLDIEKTDREYVLKKNYISFKNGPEIAINGVIIDSQGAFVMIDGDMYKAGDNIDGAILKKITLGKVFIEYEGKNYEVRT